MPSSKHIITTNEFPLLLEGLESFYNTQPTISTARATTAVGSVENPHAQLSTEHSEQQQQRQMQQRPSSQLTLFPFSRKPEVPPLMTLLATTATESCPSATQDQQVSLDIRDPERDFPRPESLHSTKNDSQSRGTYEQSIQRSSFASTTAAETSTTKTTTKTTTKPTTKPNQSQPLCTNAAEFIDNYIWHIPAPARPFVNDRRLVSHTRLPAAHVPLTIRHRSDDPFPMQDHSGDHKQSHRLSNAPKEQKEDLNGYNRHQGRFMSDPYASADLTPGPDDGRSALIILKRLRPLQDESLGTSLTEEQRLALIEQGRAIGNRLHYYDNNNRGNNRSDNNNLHPRQKYSDTNVDMPRRVNEGRRGGYRSKITYSRDFLMSFSDFNVPPDNINNIHWIQQNQTLNRPQKTAGPNTAKLQWVFQEPHGDHQGAGTYGPEMEHRLSSHDGGFGGNGDIHADIGFRRRRFVGGEGGQSTSSGNGALRGKCGFNEEGGSREGRDFRREGDGGFREDVGFRGECSFGATGIPLPVPPTSASSAPRSHVQRSSASATGGLSGKVYSFRTREPLGPPTVPRPGFQIRDFGSRTTL